MNDLRTLPEVAAILHDPAASAWLRSALRDLLVRDPVDAANDAEALAAAVGAWCAAALTQAGEWR